MSPPWPTPAAPTRKILHGASRPSDPLTGREPGRIAHAPNCLDGLHAPNQGLEDSTAYMLGVRGCVHNTHYFQGGNNNNTSPRVALAA